MGNNNNNFEDIELTVSSSPARKYDLPLISYSKEEFILGLSRADFSGKRPVVNVEEQVSFPMDCAKSFLFSLIDALTAYEREYKNGKGIDLQSK